MEAVNYNPSFSTLGNFRNRKITTLFKQMTDNNISLAIDSNLVDFVSQLDTDAIQSLFRNSSPVQQSILWEKDIVQRSLIFGDKTPGKEYYDRQVIRNLENLKKVVRSQSVKKQIYTNKYFINTLISVDSYGSRLFHCYDINKAFDAVINSPQFKALPVDTQLKLIVRYNRYSSDLLLPIDFRQRYKNIERILYFIDRSEFDESVMSQLNDDELFFLDYINNKDTDNPAIKKNILDNIKRKGKSFDQYMREIAERDDLIRERISHVYNVRYFSCKSSLTHKVFEIVLRKIDDEDIKEQFTKYLASVIAKDTPIDYDTVYNIIKRNIGLGILTYRDFYDLTINDDIEQKKIKVMFYIKFNIAVRDIAYFNGITLNQLSKINVKHVNKLIKYVKNDTQDEISSIYAICIKLYLIFGYERSIEILEGKFGNYDQIFLNNVAKADVSRVTMIEEGNKFIPSIDRRFIKFMFENPKNNHFIDMLNNKSSQCYKTWYYLYSNYDEILEKCHDEITMKKVVAILESERFDLNRRIITPDVYELNDNDFLENIVLGNKIGQSNDTVLRKIVEIYKQMKQRVESSIPYVEGNASNGYGYQTLRLDDYHIFELGYKADCCIRTLDIAHKHLLHAALCRNGRILLILDRQGKVAAFCPTKRNGNVLIVNSIECVDKNIEEHGNLITEAFNQCIKDIVNISAQSEEPIQLVCIGRNSYLKPDVVPYPTDCKTPTIHEKDDEVYKNTDQYHRTLDIVYKEEGFQLTEIKDRDPQVSYRDPRPKVSSIDAYNSSREELEKALGAIDAIRYANASPEEREEFRNSGRYYIRKCIYSKDWYVLSIFDGRIFSECLSYDERALAEYNMALQEFQDEYASEVPEQQLEEVHKSSRREGIR